MLKRIWSVCCSLKLAIIITSISTLIAISGSLVMHFNPADFGDLDAMSFVEWQNRYAAQSPGMSLWIYATGGLLALLALNTLCCFIDWLYRFSSRWRKTGEYLIHLGFSLIIIAYLWGSYAGTRSQGNTFQIGQTKPIAALKGHYLRLDAFEPLFNFQGRPIDMKNSVSLLKGDQVLLSTVVQTNTPLIYDGVTVVPASFGQETIGYNVILTAFQSTVSIRAGYSIDLLEETKLDIFTFYINAFQVGNQVVQRNQRAVNPAIQARLTRNGEVLWSGWYFLRQPLPEPLHKAGLDFVVREPITRPYSMLTINSDPGLSLALIGSICMTIGVGFALFSFYFKRRRGDRPDII